MQILTHSQGKLAQLVWCLTLRTTILEDIPKLQVLSVEVEGMVGREKGVVLLGSS